VIDPISLKIIDRFNTDLHYSVDYSVSKG